MTPEEVPDELVMPLVNAGADESETRVRLAAAITEREQIVREQTAKEVAEKVAREFNRPLCSACRKRPSRERSRGWCSSCYWRWYRAGKPETGPPEEKAPITACTSCGRTSRKYIRNWCLRCYQRWRKAGKPEAGPPALKAREPKVDEATAARLREMYAVAKKVNGGTPVEHPARAVSVKFTAELQDLVEQGVTPYELAKVIGARNVHTVYRRLERHGYRPSPPSQAGKTYKGRKTGSRS